MLRRRHAGLLAAAFAASLVCALGLASAAGALCAPIFGPCQPTATAAPAVTIATASNLTPISATLGGTVDPEGLATTYHFEYARYPDGAPVRTPAEQLSASFRTDRVSAAVTGLDPGTAYLVALVAENVQGHNQAVNGFQTPPAPAALSIDAVRASPATVRAGRPVSITARLGGQVATYARAYGAPRAQLVSEPSLPALSLNGLAESAATSGGMVRFLPVIPMRNTRFQVRLGTQHSRWVTVYVTPVLGLYTTPVGARRARMRLTYTAGGAGRPRQAHGPVVYFYRALRRGGAYRRVGAARLRRSGFLLKASVIVPARPGSYFLGCTRHRIFTDMGRTFSNDRCGRARLR